MNPDHPPCHCLLVGSSGTGKTSLWVQLAAERPARLLVYDHKLDYGRRTGAPWCETPEAIDDALARGPRYPVVFNPLPRFGHDLTAGFDWFTKLVWRIVTHESAPGKATFPGRKVFLCDELQMFGGERRLPQWVPALWEGGRSYELDTICIAQAANLIDRRIRNQVTHAAAFRTSDENAVRFLDKVGFPKGCSANLKRFHYLWRDREAMLWGEANPQKTQKS